ncbi:MAG: hypothetical protein M3Y48_22880 [Actinomycetota bacterium]|nr:hypothetical protein [Actinomycetota bacterium]
MDITSAAIDRESSTDEVANCRSSQPIEIAGRHRGQNPITNPQRGVTELFTDAGEGRDLVCAAVDAELGQSPARFHRSSSMPDHHLMALTMLTV